MGNKHLPLSVWIGMVLVTIVTGILIFLIKSYQHVIGNDVNETIDRNDIIAIRAKLFRDDDLHQIESDDCDITEYKKLIISLINSCERTNIKRDYYRSVCELRFEKKNRDSIKLTVIWMGKSKLLIASRGSYCYARRNHYYPSQKDKYVDESAALCGLVQAVLAKDKKKCDHYERLLSNSVGLNRGKSDLEE